ncbi:tRNA dihydrouridine(20/20a) synthase DusA [Thorsellia kenyensis]|uniref:tRNA-dihydrouridine(20/20a) synthase n=1 Tax=Thorsellia kenyensis TaxID=1549888 RepID=A0ABV6CCY6_9GAMM
MSSFFSHRFSVAPMLDWTTRHCRVFHRSLTKNAMLYTEMITTGAIIHGKYDHLLFNQIESPIALQLGGANPTELAFCAKKAESYGYNEINLNVGCPSDRVQNGKFGACLMAEADLVAECIDAMSNAVNIPVTVKTRIGIDELDSYEFLVNFIETIKKKSGCTHFIIHARKAWLNGLSPKQNREIPPLDYDRVFKLKHDFPELTIILNGGLKDINLAHSLLQHVDGVMLGREAYQNPMILLGVDKLFFDEQPLAFDISSDKMVEKAILAVESLYPYIENELSKGNKLSHITRHMVGLFTGIKGSKQWRRDLSELAHRPSADNRILENALLHIKNAR